MNCSVRKFTNGAGLPCRGAIDGRRPAGVNMEDNFVGLLLSFHISQVV